MPEELRDKRTPEPRLRRSGNQKDHKRAAGGPRGSREGLGGQDGGGARRHTSHGGRGALPREISREWPAAPVRESGWGCGTAKMEPAAGSAGPLIMNNKQPQPPPPPPPATAQPPPGAPRAGAALLPAGKAREFNRNQRKDSEVRTRGARRGEAAAGGAGPCSSRVHAAFAEGRAGPAAGWSFHSERGGAGGWRPGSGA